jgi:hypothetical protein
MLLVLETQGEMGEVIIGEWSQQCHRQDVCLSGDESEASRKRAGPSQRAAEPASATLPAGSTFSAADVALGAQLAAENPSELATGAFSAADVALGAQFAAENTDNPRAPRSLRAARQDRSPAARSRSSAAATTRAP